MPLHLTLTDIALRLGSCFLAVFIIGLDRGEHGHSAGLRTTLLVSLAAAVAMLQANALLDMTGKTPEHFAVMDLMRLPLGILSGIGFIGGGAILRKDKLVKGVTTAATLWFVTVLGLCFGGGQLVIGWIATAVGILLLMGLRHYERQVPRELAGLFTIHVEQNGPSVDDLARLLKAQKMKIDSVKVSELCETKKRQFEWRLSWKAGPDGAKIPGFLPEVSKLGGISFVQWDPIGG